jgi:hypothetical protein
VACKHYTRPRKSVARGHAECRRARGRPGIERRGLPVEVLLIHRHPALGETLRAGREGNRVARLVYRQYI